MQVTLYSEDYPRGLTQDWPMIPRAGDFIVMTLAGGENKQIVEEVEIYANADGSFHSVNVHCSYGGGKRTYAEAPPIA